jgi:hypothetical protein
MKPINVELTMGHDIGISASYYKPSEKEVLEDYRKAVEILSLNNERQTLQKQMLELTEKSKEENYVIKGRLSEKEKEIQSIRKRYDEDIALLKEAMCDMQQLLKNPQKLFRISTNET